MVPIYRTISYLRQKFPEMPSTLQELWQRLALVILILIAFGIAAYVKPFMRKLAMEAILSGFAGASLLWWESNSQPDEIEKLVRDIERMGTADFTPAERIAIRAEQIIAHMVSGAAILTVALYAWLAAHPHGINAAYRAEAWVLVFAVVYFLAIFGVQKCSAWHMVSIRRDLAAYPSSRHDIIRRMLRTWGFLLIGLAALLQAYPTWVSFSPRP